MATLVAVLVLMAPFAAMAAGMALIERRRERRGAEIRRQIALTDALHARLGAVVAPLVHRRGATWKVAVAVPLTLKSLKHLLVWPFGMLMVETDCGLSEKPELQLLPLGTDIIGRLAKGSACGSV